MKMFEQMVIFHDLVKGIVKEALPKYFTPKFFETYDINSVDFEQFIDEDWKPIKNLRVTISKHKK